MKPAFLIAKAVALQLATMTAGAMINAARSVLVLQRMSKEDAQKLQIPECDRKKYFSVYDDKNNKAPPALKAEWYEFVGIGLGNGDDDGPEDNIAALKRWNPPDMFAGVTSHQLYNIQLLVGLRSGEGRRLREDRRSESATFSRTRAPGLSARDPQSEGSC